MASAIKGSVRVYLQENNNKYGGEMFTKRYLYFMEEKISEDNRVANFSVGEVAIGCSKSRKMTSSSNLHNSPYALDRSTMDTVAEGEN